MSLKKLFYLILTLIVLLANSTPVFASSEADGPDRVASDMFKGVCDDYYIEPEEFKVINKEGIDISSDYFANTVSFYEAADYEAIWNYVWCNVSEIGRITSAPLIDSAMQMRASETFFVSDSKYVLVPISSDLGPLHFANNAEGQFIVMGRIDYNPNTGIISSAQTTGVTLDISSGVGWSIQAVNSYTTIFQEAQIFHLLESHILSRLQVNRYV